ncbi:MFS transporter [Pelagibius litoralis]|uniref:MFS transporter n=1 Tax=Pelagibius litoralis TaxID=374515 RepID=A0A967C1J3_9PROT|nr:MFS transporter [Pelagibius litoralis]NIA67246.1 MFS transporter [Pelagibius litoralis]
MTAAFAPITALLLSVALLLMGNGLQGTLLPVRANSEAFSGIEIGILGSSYFLGFMAGCLYGPRLIRRAGHIRAFTALVAIASCVVLVHALFLNPVLWWVLRATTGLCFAVLFMIIESWLNEKSTNDTRGLIFSLYTIINLTVITIGQLMLGLAKPEDFPLFLLASILVSLAAVPIALTRAEAPAPVQSVSIRLLHLYRLSPVGVVGCLVAGLATGPIWALGPIFAQSNGANTWGVAIFMSIVVIAGAVGQWPLGRLSDKMDRRRVIIGAASGSAIAGIVLVAWSPSWGISLLALVFLFGLFTFPLYGLCVAHTNDHVEPDGYVEAASGLLLVLAIGAVIGPIATSVLTRFFGPDALFAVTASVQLCLAAFALHRMGQRAPAPEEEHVTFVESLNMAQTVSTVDPTADTDEPDDGRPDDGRPGQGPV